MISNPSSRVNERSLVVCCVKRCVWRVVRCISGLKFNNNSKLPKNVFRNLSTANSLGASRGNSAGTNGSILMLECTWSTRLAGLVEYGTVLAWNIWTSWNSELHIWYSDFRKPNRGVVFCSTAKNRTHAPSDKTARTAAHSKKKRLTSFQHTWSGSGNQ